MLKQYLRLNTVVGVSIKVNSDNSTTIQACKIRTSKNILDFEKKVTDLVSLDELKENFPTKDFLSVNITGKGVLQKQIDKVDAISPDNFELILPNAVFDDFYIQNFISGNTSFISIIRKKEAEKFLDSLRKQGFIPIMLSLGPFPVDGILAQLNIYDDSIVFDGHTILKNKANEWISYSYDIKTNAPYPLKLENESIDEKLVLSYAVAFQAVFAGFSKGIEANVTYLEDQLQVIMSKKQTRIMAFIVLISFFLVLLSNFFTFSSLDSANKSMATQLSKISNKSSDSKSLKDNIEAKEGELKILGWDDNMDKAYFIDQLAKDLPTEMSWNSIEINPVDLEQSRNLRTIQWFERSIVVSGFSDKIVPVNKWISAIKDQIWVKSVELQSYIIDQEVNKGEFTILIKF